MRLTKLSAAALVAVHCVWLVTACTHDVTSARLTEEFLKQDEIYQSKGKDVPEGYTTDRALADYAEMLPSGFDRALAALGPGERWLDIGAGEAKAILGYYGPGYDRAHPERRSGKARAVAVSIEDRRTPLWQETAAKLPPRQIEYLHGKRLRDYSPEALGHFQLITDVVGAFSYTTDLSLVMERVLDLLQVNGSFYTVLSDVRTESGTNHPYYKGSPFSTAIANADGSEASLCSWLKSIKCAQVFCEPKQGWRPPIEAFRVTKVCAEFEVPRLELIDFEASTPPGRQFRMLPAEEGPAKLKLLR